MFNLNDIVRENVRLMQAYSSARSEYKGKASVWLDANENPFDNGINRYPDPLQVKLKEVLAEQKNITAEQLFLGNGSDEAIDLCMRAFCNPGKDKIMYFTPGYGMYKVSANLNDLECIEIPLNQSFQLDIESIAPKLDDEHLKLIFICSPNNPTGNTMNKEDIIAMAASFKGIIIIDEAYIQFSTEGSLSEFIDSYPNLVVLQTLSKSYGMAGLRIGMAIGNKDVISILNKIKPPYNINSLSQEKALQLLADNIGLQEQLDVILEERIKLEKALNTIDSIDAVYPSDANFILFTSKKYREIYQALKARGIIIRDRSSQIPNSLRISIGTPLQNQESISIIKSI